jgi:hypothetical protein
MPLIRKDTSVNANAFSAAVFETDPEMASTVEATDADFGTDVRTELAVQPPALNSVPAHAPSSTRLANLFQHLKEAMPVSYDSLPKIELKASGFTLVEGGTKVAFGDTLVFEVMSYQPSFVVSPGVLGADASALVKYSDDGKFTKDGRSCTEYLHELLRHYPKAAIKERCVVVIDLLKAPNAPKDVSAYLESEPYQIDLPPTSRKNFHRYSSLLANFLVNKGRLAKDRVQFVKAVISEKRGLVDGTKTDWAEAAFSSADV